MRAFARLIAGEADPGRDHHPATSATCWRPTSWPPEILGRVNALPGAQGAAAQARQHRGRHHHRGAELDQERRRRARPGDAPDQEGQPVALRDEGAHRRGCRLGAGAHGDHHRGQRSRRRASRRAAARQGRSACMPTAGYTRRGQAGASARSCDWQIAAKRGKIKAMPEGRAEACAREAGDAQGQRAGAGRAPVPRDQAPVRSDEGALPRAGQEHGARDHAVRAVEPVDGAT